MTHATTAPNGYVKRASRRTRPASTVRLRWLMEEAQKLEIAARIRELRQRGPYTQDTIADKLGIKLRAYQKVEKEGTTRFERCEELAAIHAEWTSRSEDYQHVSAQWLWDGKTRPVETPDVLGQLKPSTEPGEGAQELLHQILDQQGELLEIVRDLRQEAAAQERPGKPQESASRSRARKRS